MSYKISAAKIACHKIGNRKILVWYQSSVNEYKIDDRFNNQIRVEWELELDMSLTRIILLLFFFQFNLY